MSPSVTAKWETKWWCQILAQISWAFKQRMQNHFFRPNNPFFLHSHQTVSLTAACDPSLACANYESAPPGAPTIAVVIPHRCWCQWFLKILYTFSTQRIQTPVFSPISLHWSCVLINVQIIISLFKKSTLRLTLRLHLSVLRVGLQNSGNCQSWTFEN